MPTTCVSCGRVRDVNLNLTNWQRHVNACKKRKSSKNYNNHTLTEFLIPKKQKTHQDNGKFFKITVNNQ